MAGISTGVKRPLKIHKTAGMEDGEQFPPKPSSSITLGGRRDSHGARDLR